MLNLTRTKQKYDEVLLVHNMAGQGAQKCHLYLTFMWFGVGFSMCAQVLQLGQFS